MDDQVDVTVIIPARNAETFISETLSSLVSQTMPRWRAIVVDDHSTDATADRVAAFGDPRVELVANDGAGLADALNSGLRRNSSDFIARLDADDVALPTRLQEQLAFLRANPHVFLVGTQIDRCSADLTVLSRSDLPVGHRDIVAGLLKGRHTLAHSSVMFRQGSAIAYSSRPAEDWEFFLRATSFGALANTESVQLRYRFHSSSINSTKLRAHRRDMYRCIRSFEQDAGNPSRLPPALLELVDEARTGRDVRSLTAYRRSVALTGEPGRGVERVLLGAYASALMPGAFARRVVSALRTRASGR